MIIIDCVQFPIHQSVSIIKVGVILTKCITHKC